MLTYDAYDRPVRTQINDEVPTEYVYDERGNIVSATRGWDAIARFSVFAALVLLVTTGCTKTEDGPRDVKVLCELRNADQVIQVVTYQYTSNAPLPHVGGNYEVGAVIYRDDTANQTVRLIDDLMDVKATEHEAKSICTRSSITGDVVIVFPVTFDWAVSRSGVKSEISERDYGDVFLIKQGRNAKFSLRRVRAPAAPFIVDAESRAISIFRQWATVAVNPEGDRLRAVQQVMLWSTAKRYDNDPAFIRYACCSEPPIRSSTDMDDWVDYAYSHVDATGCDYCKPIMSRSVTSVDMGRTWQLADYTLLKGVELPAEARLPPLGDDYQVDPASRKQDQYPKVIPRAQGSGGE